MTTPPQELASRPATSMIAPPKVAPFLRWAGGKRWFIPQLSALGQVAQPAASYFEPFLGGASAFFGMQMRGAAQLSDVNGDLIDVYRTVRARPADVAEALGGFPNDAETYYQIRSNRSDEPVRRTAEFIYLNHTSFNGIHRVNLKGEYNVPFGYRKSVNMPTAAHLIEVASLLETVKLEVSDFEDALQAVKPGDFVFLDPPYTVAHNNNGFIKYNQNLFSFDDQRRLAASIATLASAGAYFVLTNAAHQSIVDLFSNLGRMIPVSRKSAIGGKAAKRGRAEELVFTNVPERTTDGNL